MYILFCSSLEYFIDTIILPVKCLQILNYDWGLVLLSSKTREICLYCHLRGDLTCCRAVCNRTVTTCFTILGLLRPEFEHTTIHTQDKHCVRLRNRCGNWLLMRIVMSISGTRNVKKGIIGLLNWYWCSSATQFNMRYFLGKIRKIMVNFIG